MQKATWYLFLLYTFLNCFKSIAQGPPITSDKPLMLGQGSWVVRSLTESRNTDRGTFTKTPLILHYLITKNAFIGVHIPLVHLNFNSVIQQANSPVFSLGDIELIGKYQFYKKDGMGKTFRLAAKALQVFPTGDALEIQGISTGMYQAFISCIAGYESLHYGISNELGYNIQPFTDLDELRYKLSFGLPLMKPTYPVKKINLYFEYQGSWFMNLDNYMLLYAQGIQYAKNQFTIETAIQFPLLQKAVDQRLTRNYSLFLGARYIF